MGLKVKVFDGQTSDANSTAMTWDKSSLGTVWGEGTWGGGTISLETSPDSGTTWVPADDGSNNHQLTADGALTFQVAEGPEVQVRVALSGSSGANLNVWIGNGRV